MSATKVTSHKRENRKEEDFLRHGIATKTELFVVCCTVKNSLNDGHIISVEVCHVQQMCKEFLTVYG